MKPSKKDWKYKRILILIIILIVISMSMIIFVRILKDSKSNSKFIDYHLEKRKINTIDDFEAETKKVADLFGIKEKTRHEEYIVSLNIISSFFIDQVEWWAIKDFEKVKEKLKIINNEIENWLSFTVNWKNNFDDNCTKENFCNELRSIEKDKINLFICSFSPVESRRKVRNFDELEKLMDNIYLESTSHFDMDKIRPIINSLRAYVDKKFMKIHSLISLFINKKIKDNSVRDLVDKITKTNFKIEVYIALIDFFCTQFIEPKIERFESKNSFLKIKISCVQKK